MIQQKQAAFKAQPTQLNFPLLLIAELKEMAEQRFHAISMYPNSFEAQKKLQEIQNIRCALQDAKFTINQKHQVIICLRLELAFHTIAGSPIKKMNQTYMLKLNTLMQQARDFLGWQKQH